MRRAAGVQRGVQHRPARPLPPHRHLQSHSLLQVPHRRQGQMQKQYLETLIFSKGQDFNSNEIPHLDASNKQTFVRIEPVVGKC